MTAQIKEILILNGKKCAMNKLTTIPKSRFYCRTVDITVETPVK
jgi:hypothetical protein